MAAFDEIKARLVRIWPHLDERARRMIAATEARQLGYGGGSIVSRACGLSRVTITKGFDEVDDRPPPPGPGRPPRAGRPRIFRPGPGLRRRPRATGKPFGAG